ncbi:MAG: hypothetical protein V1782_12220 [Pseudomonadota bacterium]
MKYTKGTQGLLVAILIMGTSMNAFGFLGFGGTEKWKEEVQLNDGRIIVVERETLHERGGGEIVSNRSGTKPKERRIRFAHLDGSGKIVEWRSSKVYRTWPEKPLILDVESGHPIVFTSVGIKTACECYSKYVYRNGGWIEEVLPETFGKRITNLFIRDGIDMPKFVDLETKRKGNAEIGYSRSLRQVGPTRQVCGD